MNTPEEFKQVGSALLATVRNVMSGAEIEACERMVSGQHHAELEAVREWKDAPKCPHCDLPIDRSLPTIPPDSFGLDDEEDRIKSLHVQFYREITEFIDNENRVASRRAVETHDRLQSQKQVA